MTLFKGLGKTFQCKSLYPTPPESLDFISMTFLKERYEHKAGSSDYFLGSDSAQITLREYPS